jgi:hypothetical protein
VVVRPNYERGKVESVMLEVAAELHPARLTIETLIGKIVCDAEDAREVAVARHAIDGLCEFELFEVGDGEVVGPTAAGLHAVALLCR